MHDIRISDDGATIRAMTQGSQAVPYRQDIRIMVNGFGPNLIVGACTCPVGRNCKHVAAVLIASQRLVPGDAVLPAGVSLWLNMLRLTPTEPPATARRQLIYVLRANAERRLEVDPRSVTLRRDGAVQSAKRFSPASGHYTADYLLPADRVLLRRLSQMRYYAPLIENDDDPADLLARLLATGRAQWGDENGPTLAAGDPRPGSIAWRIGEDGMQRPELASDTAVDYVLLPEPWYVDLASGEIGKLDLGLPDIVAARLLCAPAIPLDLAERVASEMENILTDIDLPVPVVPQQAALIATPPVPRLRLIRADLPFDPARRRLVPRAAPSGKFPTPMARLSFGYGPIDIPFSRAEGPVSVVHQGTLYRIQRDPRAEPAILARLGGIGFGRLGDYIPVFYRHGHEDDFLLEDDQNGTDWVAVMLEEIPALQAKGWDVTIAEDFPFNVLEPQSAVEAELVEATGVDWLELHLGVMVDGERVDLIPLLVQMIVNGSLDGLLDHEDDPTPFLVPLPDGRLLALPRERIGPTLHALMELYEGGNIDAAAKRIAFGRRDAAVLAAFEEASGLEWAGGESLRALGAMLRAAGGAIPPVKVPDSFQGTLRHYQEQGVAWLQFLAAASLGGVLADDMGLGKTVQTLAHLVIEQAEGRLDRPALIVCPTSLIPNWTLEAARFAPSLRLLALHGPNRKERFAEIGAHDLVLTTYPLLTRDHEALTAQDWHAVILDEAQTIKNPDAATTRQALRLQARQRLCLSGTPLQNHLGELWSLFDFLAPGFLGDAKSFRARYRMPIEKHADAERHDMLVRRVRPFLLRRTKDEVATELPPKTEITESIELGPVQRAIYEGIRLAMHARVQAAIAERGLARSGIIVLDALLKMRQACCDPRLLNLKAAQHGKAGSAKLERLMELLEVLLGEGRRVLLFSQFTSMLALIEERFVAAGIDYVMLTGDTVDRSTPVRRFQAGEVPVFLISLKAGGVGLNLTAADTVIHYDPWWNPAVEDQATDRAHRIGQDKRVFVHRLITLGSIEEKMEGLKGRKRALVASVLSAGQGGALKLSEDDITELFAPA